MTKGQKAKHMAAPPKAKKPTRVTLAAFTPLAQNPNTHTQQGLGQLDAAMSRHGYVAPMTAAADGAILDGNARLETVATKFPGVEPIIVKHDGTRPIIAVRTDIANADAPMARDIIVSANRIAEVDLRYDVEVLRAFMGDGLDLTPYEFDAELLKEIAGDVPTFEPVDEETQGRLDQKKPTTCPSCGHVFTT